MTAARFRIHFVDWTSCVFAIAMLYVALRMLGAGAWSTGLALILGSQATKAVERWSKRELARLKIAGQSTRGVTR